MSLMHNVFAKPTWYAAGLAFECLGCGNCCAGPDEGYVWVTKQQIAEIADYLGISEKHVLRKYLRKIGRRFSLVEREDNKDCVFLGPAGGGRNCRIYPVRPTQCRTWPFWVSNLRFPKDWTLAALRCRGINRGPTHNCDEIQANRKAIRS